MWAKVTKPSEELEMVRKVKISKRKKFFLESGLQEEFQAWEAGDFGSRSRVGSPQKQAAALMALFRFSKIKTAAWLFWLF